jgi:hypothetical protein
MKGRASEAQAQYLHVVTHRDRRHYERQADDQVSDLIRYAGSARHTDKSYDGWPADSEVADADVVAHLTVAPCPRDPGREEVLTFLLEVLYRDEKLPSHAVANALFCLEERTS